MADRRRTSAEGERAPARPGRAGPRKKAGGAAPSSVLLCQVEGCTRRLAREKEYYQRYRVCKFHSAQAVVTLGGEPHRFCQQCCMFQHLTAFDGERRSCRERLLLHNSRRKQRVEARAESPSDSDDQTAQPAAPAEAQGAVHVELHASIGRGAGWAANEPSALLGAAGAPHVPSMAPPPRRARTFKATVAGGSGSTLEDQDGEAAALATRMSGTSSCRTTERLGSSELQGNYRAYPPLRSQSASHFSVSEVAEMWARDDEVFGGPQAAADLDLNLDVFGTLSVTLEDLPKDGTAASVDDCSDHITLPAAGSRRGSYSNSHLAPSELPRPSYYNGVHPAAAALKHQWSAQQQPSPPQQLPQPPLAPTPTAALLKRHWTDTMEQPKEMFARVSWGSGGVGSTPVKARFSRNSWGRLPAALPPGSSSLTADPALGMPYGPYDPAAGIGLAAQPLPISQGTTLPPPARHLPRHTAQHSGGSSGGMPPGSPVSGGSGTRSLLQVHTGGVSQSPRTAQPLLPDPFADMTVTAGPAAGMTLMGSAGAAPPYPMPGQAFGVGPQAAQQQQQQPVRHALSQPVVMDRSFGMDLAQQQAGRPGSWQRTGAGSLQAAAPVQPVASVPLQQQQQPHNPFAASAAATHTPSAQMVPQGHERQLIPPPPFTPAGIQPGGLHLGPDGVPLGSFPGVADGGLDRGSGGVNPGMYPVRSANVSISSAPRTEGLPQQGRQASWPAAAVHWHIATTEPVAHTVVIGGSGPPAVPSPFCLPPGVSRQSSLTTGSPMQASPQRSIRSGSSGPGGSGAATADFVAAHATATSARAPAGLRPGGRDSPPDGGDPRQQGAVSALPYNPFSASMRRMRAATGATAPQQQADPVASVAYTPARRLTPLWATRSELQQKQQLPQQGRRHAQHHHHPPHQQQPGSGSAAGPAGGSAAMPPQLNDLRPSLQDAIDSLDSALGVDRPKPAPASRRRSLCTATAQQLRM